MFGGGSQNLDSYKFCQNKMIITFFLKYFFKKGYVAMSRKYVYEKFIAGPHNLSIVNLGGDRILLKTSLSS